MSLTTAHRTGTPGRDLLRDFRRTLARLVKRLRRKPSVSAIGATRMTPGELALAHEYAIEDMGADW